MDGWIFPEIKLECVQNFPEIKLECVQKAWKSRIMARKKAKAWLKKVLKLAILVIKHLN